MSGQRRWGRPTRGVARPPSVPVADPVTEALEAETELAHDVRQLQLETVSGFYARGQSEL